jgi:hypothetical protein
MQFKLEMKQKVSRITPFHGTLKYFKTALVKPKEVKGQILSFLIILMILLIFFKTGVL